MMVSCLIADTIDMTARLRIATRKSPLAMWQARYIQTQLQQHHPQLDVELVTFTTRGDKILDTPLAKIGGKGLFVKELEVALLNDQADIAVHSMKDVPMAFPEGLELGVICARENPRDAWVSDSYSSIDHLPQGARVGTSSLRRQCQLMHHRPDLDIRSLRGNVQTRLSKLDNGEFDAIVLACAGLIRLDLGARIASELPIELSLPAGGQGAVGVEWRCDDTDTHALLKPLHHPPTANCVLAERALNQHLQGGCQVPIAAFAQYEHDQIHLQGRVGSPDGVTLLKAHGDSLLAGLNTHEQQQAACALGVKVAKQLLDQGAGAILEAVVEP